MGAQVSGQPSAKPLDRGSSALASCLASTGYTMSFGTDMSYLARSIWVQTTLAHHIEPKLRSKGLSAAWEMMSVRRMSSMSQFLVAVVMTKVQAPHRLVAQ